MPIFRQNRRLVSPHCHAGNAGLDRCRKGGCSMTVAAIIVAAGRGTRTGGGVPKQWQMLAGRPVLVHTVAAFAALWTGCFWCSIPTTGLGPSGGCRRRIWSRAAPRAMPRSAMRWRRWQGTGVSRVLIHDGARPLVSRALIGRMLAALQSHQGAAPALPVTDALWRGEGPLLPERRTGRACGARRHRRPFASRPSLPRIAPMRADAADDVEVARAAGLDVAIVEGEEDQSETDLRRRFRACGGDPERARHGYTAGQRL